MILLKRLNPLNLIKRNPITKPEHFIYTQEWSETPNTKPETLQENGLCMKDVLKNHIYMIAFKNNSDEFTLPLKPIVVSRKQSYKANLIKNGISQRVYTESFIPLKKATHNFEKPEIMQNALAFITHANCDEMIWYSEKPAAIYARNILTERLSKFIYPDGQPVRDVTFEVISGYEALEKLYGDIDNVFN